MFFYANSSVTIDQPAFWDQSYLLKSRILKSFHDTSTSIFECDSTVEANDQNDLDAISCPLFLKNIARGIISAGKSLKLVRFLDDESHSKFGRERYHRIQEFFGHKSSPKNSEIESIRGIKYAHGSKDIRYLTLPESFLISFVGLICDGNRIADDIIKVCGSFSGISKIDKIFEEGCIDMVANLDSESLWWKFFMGTVKQKNEPTFRSFYSENPAITVCQELANETHKFREELNISRNFELPSLDDEILREAVFGINSDLSGTDYKFGFKYNESEYLHSMSDVESLRYLYPFPTILPCVRVSLVIVFVDQSW